MDLPMPSAGKGGVNNISSAPGRAAYQAVGYTRRLEAQRDDQERLDEMCRPQLFCNLRNGCFLVPMLGLMTHLESNPRATKQ